MTTAEAAEFLHVNELTNFRIPHRGTLPRALKVGTVSRIPSDEPDAFAVAQRRYNDRIEADSCDRRWCSYRKVRTAGPSPELVR